MYYKVSSSSRGCGNHGKVVFSLSRLEKPLWTPCGKGRDCKVVFHGVAAVVSGGSQNCAFPTNILAGKRDFLHPGPAPQENAGTPRRSFPNFHRVWISGLWNVNRHRKRILKMFSAGYPQRCPQSGGKIRKPCGLLRYSALPSIKGKNCSRHSAKSTWLVAMPA